MRQITLIIATILAPGLAFAQEITGQITAALQGEDRVWYITEAVQGSQSDWTDFGYAKTVSLFGHTADNTVTLSKEGLLISFQITGSDSNIEVSSPEVKFLSEGMFKAHAANSEDGAVVEVASATVEGDRLIVEGSFSANLTFTELMLRKKDPENTLSVDGTFMANIGPVR